MIASRAYRYIALRYIYEGRQCIYTPAFERPRLIPAFAGMTSSFLIPIPAFAGMNFIALLIHHPSFFIPSKPSLLPRTLKTCAYGRAPTDMRLRTCAHRRPHAISSFIVPIPANAGIIFIARLIHPPSSILPHSSSLRSSSFNVITSCRTRCDRTRRHRESVPSRR
jgi:hypothetical protein